MLTQNSINEEIGNLLFVENFFEKMNQLQQQKLEKTNFVVLLKESFAQVYDTAFHKNKYISKCSSSYFAVKLQLYNFAHYFSTDADKSEDKSFVHGWV